VFAVRSQVVALDAIVREPHCGVEHPGKQFVDHRARASALPVMTAALDRPRLERPGRISGPWR
jgi:hypothetical protein